MSGGHVESHVPQLCIHLGKLQPCPLIYQVRSHCVAKFHSHINLHSVIFHWSREGHPRLESLHFLCMAKMEVNLLQFWNSTLHRRKKKIKPNHLDILAESCALCSSVTDILTFLVTPQILGSIRHNYGYPLHPFGVCFMSFACVFWSWRKNWPPRRGLLPAIYNSGRTAVPLVKWRQTLTRMCGWSRFEN